MKRLLNIYFIEIDVCGNAFLAPSDFSLVSLGDHRQRFDLRVEKIKIITSRLWLYPSYDKQIHRLCFLKYFSYIFVLS